MFNINFLQLLNYFIGIETYNELIGFKNFFSIKDSLIKNQGEEYVNMMIHYLKNFKDLINKKKGNLMKIMNMKNKLLVVLN